MLTNIDENGKAIQMPTKSNKDGEKVEEKSIKLELEKIIQTTEDKTIELDKTEYTADDILGKEYSSLDDYLENYIKPLITELDYKEADLKVHTKQAIYYYDNDKETIIEQTGKNLTALGGGKIVIKATAKKGTVIVKEGKKKATKVQQTKSINITVELTKDLQKDYEIIQYSPDEATNQKNIADFMAKYVTKPFEYIENVIGVEINFNKVFYTPEKLREVPTITTDLKRLNLELLDLENSLDL